MEKIRILEPFGDSETGHSYYPGELNVDEEIPASTAQRALAAGVAEVIEHEGEEVDEPESAPEPEDRDEEFVG